MKLIGTAGTVAVALAIAGYSEVETEGVVK